MFPEPQDHPASQIELAHLSCVAVDIVPQFARPEVPPCPRTNIVLGTSMPETAIHKNGHQLAGEHEVRAAAWRPQVKAIANATTPEFLAKLQLGRRVPPTNPAHLL